jgi:hypothetical protein
MTLGEFLQREAASRAPWNCSTMAADWCMALGHPDFAKRWRRITTGPAIRKATRRGLVRLWLQGIGPALPVVADLRMGDIAVIEAGGEEAGAIFTGQRWAMRRERGLLFVAPEGIPILKVWRP